MKKHIQTPQELIIALASKGDPTAFYSLVAGQLEKKYLHLRSSSTSHHDAAQAVILEATKLFDKLKGTHPLDFDEWLESQIEAIPSADDTAEFSIEGNLSHECKTFLRELQRNLIRQVSIMGKKRNLAHVFQFFKKRLPNRPVAITASAIIAIILCFYFYLIGSRSHIKIVYNDSHKDYSISIPLNSNDISESTKPIQTADSAKKDSTVDTVTAAPPPPSAQPPAAPPAPAVKKVVIRPRKTELEPSNIPSAAPLGISEQPIERSALESATATEPVPTPGRADSQNE